MPNWVATLQQKFLTNPVKVSIPPAADVQSAIEQIAYQVPQEQKVAALCTLLHATEGESSLIFGRTKHGVEKLGKQLSKLGFTVGTLHGNKSQRAREAALSAFRLGQVQTLLATNVAARGLDITGIDQVINYELPESSELFTHRVGRTGRMGRQGKAITLLVPAEVPQWRRMTRSLGQAVALQRLALDEEAVVSLSSTRPEAAGTQEYEQNGKPQPVRGGKQFSPERSYPGKGRHGRRGAGKQSSFGRTTGKHEAPVVAATAPQRRTARRKPRATPEARVRRAAASNRPASRSHFSHKT